MNFVFIGAGAIAHRCLLEFSKICDDRLALVGVACPHELYNSWQLPTSNNEEEVRFIELNMQERNESVLESLIRETQPDFVLSVQYPWILSDNFLKMVNYHVLNLHNAKLPDYRGHNTISHEIINKEEVHVSTLHWMDKEVDRGSLVIEKRVRINVADTAYSLWKKSVDSCLEVFGELMGNCVSILANKMECKSIMTGGQYYYKNSIAKLKEIPLGATTEEIDRISRAFWFPPHEPAYLMFNGHKLYTLPHNYRYDTEFNVRK